MCHPQSLVASISSRAGYILSRAIFRKIDELDEAGRIHVLPLEDVGLATWVKQIDTEFPEMRIRWVHDARFSYCCCNHRMLSGHYIDPDGQLSVFERDRRGVAAICPNPRDNDDWSAGYSWGQ